MRTQSCGLGQDSIVPHDKGRMWIVKPGGQEVVAQFL